MNLTWKHGAIELPFLHLILIYQWVIKGNSMERIWSHLRIVKPALYGRNGEGTSPQPSGTPPCIEEVTFSFLFLQTGAIQVCPTGSASCYVFFFFFLHCLCHNLQYKVSAVTQQSCNSPLQSGSKAPFIRQEPARTNHILPYQPDEYYLL